MPKEAVLIHGWDPRYYNKNIEEGPVESVAWNHRDKLLGLLGDHYKLKYFNLPGFCGAKEPDVKYFNVEDFSDRLASWIRLNSKRPAVIIGYSFGGAIALDYKVRYKAETPVVLISPAILRSQSLKSELGKQAKKFVPSNLLATFKNAYQYLFSEYYRLGTPFLRLSYDEIVRRDLSSLLDQVNPGGVLLIYGTKDRTTPWDLTREVTERNGIESYLIEGGNHNIGQTNPQEIVKAIDKFLAKE